MAGGTGKSGRGWRVVLILSLALNLLVLGAAGGWVLRHGIGPEDPQGPRVARTARSGGPLTRALDAEGQAAIMARLRGDHRAHRARHAALRESYRALLADLRAQPFDTSQVEARLAAQRGQVADRLAAGHNALVAHLAAMSTAERAAYADRLEAALRRWRHHRHPR